MWSKRGATMTEEPTPIQDEGWWASVLADEEAVSNGGKSQVAKSVQPEPVSNGVNWERTLEMYEHDEIIPLEVYGFNRGGLLVRGEGIQGFVPVSHLVEMPCSPEGDQRRAVLANYVGRVLHLKVIECEPTQDRVVLSERAALAGEGRRRELFHTLRTGELVSGTVTNVTTFGAFIDLGGLEGLVHVSELSWGRVQHPADLVKVGDTIRALVLSVSEENGRVALSIKRLCPNPWELVSQSYQPGDIIPAEVTAIMRFGAFARIKEGVEGLIHVSTIHLPSDCRELEGYMHIGQPVQVRILHIDAERRRLGLGLVNLEA